MGTRITIAEVIAHNERVARGRSGPIEPVAQAVRETGRGGLQEQIKSWLDSQWPRWKYRYARPDKPTTEQAGVEDFTVFSPGGITHHIEVKSKTGKPSPDQLAWAAELSLLGHTVHIVRSMAEFEAVVKNPPRPNGGTGGKGDAPADSQTVS